MRVFFKAIATVALIAFTLVIYDSACDLINQPSYQEQMPTVDIAMQPEEQPATSVQLPSETEQGTESSESVRVNYSWSYEDDWTWELDIPVSLYEYYRQLPRPPTGNYSVYVTHPSDDPYIEMLVEKIEEAASKKGFSEYQTVEFAAAFVQGLPYTADSVSTPYDEYPRYPIETLLDNGGDCEDTSILLASIVDKMGYGVALIVTSNHCAVGLKGSEKMYGSYYEYEGSRYYYVETTGEGWGIGEIPDQYRNSSANIYPIIPTPVITHEATVRSNGYMAEVEVTVRNEGTAPAYSVTVLAGFDAGENMLWNSQKCEPFTLGIGQKATVKLTLQVPLNKYTRLIVQVGNDNVLVDESYTSWFDT